MFDFNKINDGIQKIANAAQALSGGEESITIRHAGLAVTAPYAGNEGRTILEVLRAYGADVAIPAGASPSVTSPGVGARDVNDKVAPGDQFDAFTDKKDNASA